MIPMNKRRAAIMLTTALSTMLGAVPSPAQTAPTEPDPPARVGRIARLSGTVSFHPQAADRWETATRNYPLIVGDALWTEPRSAATVDLGGARIALNDTTEIRLDRIDPDDVAATAAQGELCLAVDPTPDPQSYIVHTPRGDIAIKQPGRYGVIAGDTQKPTSLIVFAGSAEIAQGTNTLQVAAGQSGVLTGTDNFDARVAPLSPDPFLAAACASRPAPARAAAAAPITTMMVGAADLDDYGAWQTAPDYGPVWYPRVAAGWIPYRHGHWAFVPPWGWTWIDDAPWGFAPFHYGRWAQFGGRWGWVPVGEAVERAPAPIYAPALVSFIAPAAALGAIAWLPLGPREPYHPWYHASDTYVRNVNIRQVQSVTNVSEVTNRVTINNFVNHGATTAVPAAIMTQSRPVAAIARPLQIQAITAARPLFGSEPARPTIQTQGVTPALATRLQLPAPTTSEARPAAPGPALRQAEPTGRVPLHQAGQPLPTQPQPPPPAVPLATPGMQHARPGEVIAPAPGGIRPNSPQPSPQPNPQPASPPAPEPARPRPPEPAQAAPRIAPTPAVPAVRPIQAAPPSHADIRRAPAPPTPHDNHVQPPIIRPETPRSAPAPQHRPPPSPAPVHAGPPAPHAAPPPRAPEPRPPAPHREERRPEHP